MWNITSKTAKKFTGLLKDQAAQTCMAPQRCMSKGQIDLETAVIQSLVEPIGVPAYVARYKPARKMKGSR